jgi:membrane-bound ClpP family serine protease
MLVSRVDVCGARSRLLVAAMNRSSGIGLTSFGMVLVVVGAILRFATSVQTSGFNIDKVGDIFLLVGILMVILSRVIIALGSRRRVVTHTEVLATPTGQQRTDQRDDWGVP